MIFKPNDQVLVIDNASLLDYTDTGLAGKSGVIVGRATQDGWDGYLVEFTSLYGFKSMEFIRADHIIPAPSKLLSTSKPKWEKKASDWQERLWKEKMKD